MSTDVHADVSAPLDFEALWQVAMPYADFLASARDNLSLWEGVFRNARIPEWVRDAVPAEGLRLLALVEDWCGDASNTVPVLARAADEVPGLAFRCLLRDQHPAVMDRYLTNGARSIPIVIVLDHAWQELRHWGPRPSALQQWVMENKGTMPKEQLYPEVRKWYARDRGETTLKEVLASRADHPGERQGPAA